MESLFPFQNSGVIKVVPTIPVTPRKQSELPAKTSILISLCLINCLRGNVRSKASDGYGFISGGQLGMRVYPHIVRLIDAVSINQVGLFYFPETTLMFKLG